MFMCLFLFSIKVLKKCCTRKRLSFLDSPNFFEILFAKSFLVSDNYYVPVPVPVPVPVLVLVLVPVPVPVPGSSSIPPTSLTLTVIS